MNWRCFSGILLGLIPSGLLGQTDALERFMEEQVVLGVWTPHEASSVIHHMASFGRPAVPQEAGAIQGLRPATIASLAEEVSWVNLCTGVLGQSEHKSPRISGSWTSRVVTPRLEAAVENGLSQSLRMKKQGHWALRVDRSLESKHLEQIAGYLSFKNIRKQSLFVVGDHVLRWGMGLNVWDQSPFARFNVSLSVLPSAHWLTPVWGASSSQHRSGVARTRELEAWRFAWSVSIAGHVVEDDPMEPLQWRNLGWIEAKSVEGIRRIRELRMSQLVRRQFHWGSLGVVGEGGAFLHKDSLKHGFGWFGLHAEGHRNNVRWATETMHFGIEHAMRLTVLKNIGINWDVFGSIQHQQHDHPAWRWNDARSSPGTRFIWGGQKLGTATSKWSGTWRADTWRSADDAANRTMRFQCKALLFSDAVTQIQGRWQWQATSDLHGWFAPHWRHSIRWQRDQAGLKMRIQAFLVSDSGVIGASGFGMSCWMEGREIHWRWKVVASSWRVPDGLQLYGSEPTLQGVGAQVMTGVGSRLSWWLEHQLTDGLAIHWSGHAAVRSDRLSISYSGFSTDGPVQTAMDFRLTVSL